MRWQHPATALWSLHTELTLGTHWAHTGLKGQEVQGLQGQGAQGLQGQEAQGLKGQEAQGLQGQEAGVRQGLGNG